MNWFLQADLTTDQLTRWSALPRIAVDTELHGLRLGRDQVLLVQVADGEGNVALVRTVGRPDCPPRLRSLLENPAVVKVYHFAVADLCFLRRCFGVTAAPFWCTRTVSRLVRTYTQSHGLRDVVKELAGVDLDKQAQQTDWSRSDLTPQQLQYAANDVLHLLRVDTALNAMLKDRGILPNGTSLPILAQRAMEGLAVHVDLLLAGFGTGPDGWKVDLFEHV